MTTDKSIFQLQAESAKQNNIKCEDCLNWIKEQAQNDAAPCKIFMNSAINVVHKNNSCGSGILRESHSFICNKCGFNFYMKEKINDIYWNEEEKAYLIGPEECPKCNNFIKKD